MFDSLVAQPVSQGASVPLRLNTLPAQQGRAIDKGEPSPGRQEYLSYRVIPTAAQRHIPRLGGRSEQQRECGSWRDPPPDHLV